MPLKAMAATFAFAGLLGGALAFSTAPADAQTRRVVTSRGDTVYVNRDEAGRKRTRIIVQKRSYLNPGTETFPGERSDHEYAFLPGQSGISVLDNTAFGRSQSALPEQFSLPSRRTPWLQF